MRIPRDLSGRDLIKYLSALGYEVSRQSRSHIRLTTQQNGEHHVTISNLNPIKIGTLSSILNEIAQHFGKSKEDIIAGLF